MFGSRSRLVGLFLLGLLLALSAPFSNEGFALEERIVTLYQNGPAGVVRRGTVNFEEGLNELTRAIPGTARTSTVFVDISEGTLRTARIKPPVDSEREILNEQIGEILEVRQSGDAGNWIEGKLVKLVGGNPMLETSSGQVRLIREPEGFRFKDSPLREAGNLLEVEYVAEDEGETAVTLGYQVNRLSWSPQYVGFLNEESQVLRLRGIAHIENDTGWDFDESELYLLAGSPAREDQGSPRLFAASNVAQEKAGSPEKTFEYYRYPASSPVSLKAGEETRIGFIEERLVDYRRYYEFDYSVSSAVRSFLVLKNDEKEGLGLPLASGPVRIYADNEERTFFGGDTLSKLPEGSSTELELGEAFDLEGERTRRKHEKLGEDHWRDRISVTLTNRKDSSEKIRVVEKLPGSWEITRSSEEYEKIDSDRVLFEVEIPAKTSKDISYTVQYRY